MPNRPNRPNSPEGKNAIIHLIFFKSGFCKTWRGLGDSGDSGDSGGLRDLRKLRGLGGTCRDSEHLGELRGLTRTPETQGDSVGLRGLMGFGETGDWGGLRQRETYRLTFSFTNRQTDSHSV